MTEGIRWVGLDVHANQTAGAVFDSTTGEVRSRKFAGRPHEVMPWLLELPGPVRAVYEAGPTGYGLARRARAAGLDMQVRTPGMIAKAPADRVKTDKRDALKLARLHAAGQLVLVHLPKLEHEQLRDLARCREDVRGDLMRARHRIGNLLRREIYFSGRGRAWTREHRSWLAGVRFDDRPSELTFADYLHAHDVLLARRDTLDRAIAEIATESPWAEIIGRLRCLHGIDTLSAFGICAEVCDFERFLRPTAFSAYLGSGPERAHKRRQAPPGRDHQGRLRARAPPVGRGGPPLRPPSADRRRAATPPRRTRGLGDRPLLARAAPPARPLASPTRPPPSPRRRDRRCRRPASWPTTAGNSPWSEPNHRTTRVRFSGRRGRPAVAAQ